MLYPGVDPVLRCTSLRTTHTLLDVICPTPLLRTYTCPTVYNTKVEEKNNKK